MSALAGKRVLVVEDEALVAFALEDMLMDLGCEVIGPAVRLGQGLALAGSEALDCAVLDVNLGAERSYPVADALASRGVPYLFATGYGVEGIERPYAAAPVLRKPYNVDDLRARLLALLCT